MFLWRVYCQYMSGQCARNRLRFKNVSVAAIVTLTEEQM